MIDVNILTEKRKLSELNPAVYNPRIISDKAKEGLKTSLEKFGLLEDIIWNKRTGNIVGGHQRYYILKEQGIDEVQVKVVDLDDIQEKALNITLNNPYIQGEFNVQDLPQIINDIKINDVTLYDTLLLKTLDVVWDLDDKQIKNIENIPSELTPLIIKIIIEVVSQNSEELKSEIIELIDKKKYDAKIKT